MLWEQLQLRWLRSQPYSASSHVYCNQPAVVNDWHLNDLRTEVTREEKMKEKNHLAAGPVSVLLCRKSWHKLHLSAVMEKISRLWFSDVQKWTELPQLTGSWSISQDTWVCSCALNAQHIRDGSCFHQIDRWGESEQKPLSFMDFPY